MRRDFFMELILSVNRLTSKHNFYKLIIELKRQSSISFQ